MRTMRAVGTPLNPIIGFFVHLSCEARAAALGRRLGPVFALSLMLLVGLSTAAEAGIADTPLPMFSDNSSAVSILEVPGIIKRNGIETVFLCTSLSGTAVNVGVELFDANGVLLNDVHAGNGAVLGVGPGQTVTFGTSSTLSYLETQLITLTAGTTIAQGSARVVAGSSQVRCNVMILDKGTTPPVSLATLGQGIQPEAVAIPSGIALPIFSDGHAATHSAVFPGIISRNVMETVVSCTSLAGTNIDIGIEVLNADGTSANSVNAGNGAILNVSSGRTVTFSTGATAAFFDNSILSIAGSVAQGLVRVVSNSGQLTCSAIVLDAAPTATGAPPAAMSNMAGSAATASASNVALTSPLPQFSDGKQSVSIATVSGVLKRDDLQTLFLCTSVDSVPVDIGVQIFDGSGALTNDVGAGVGASLNVAPGETVTVATSTTSAYLETIVIPTQNKLQGLGRIVASSDQVRCNVVVADDLVTPPATAMVIGDAVRPALGALPTTVPLPQFSDGSHATHAAYFPGIVKRGDVETDIFCTSIASGPINIGVQFFTDAGVIANDVTMGVDGTDGKGAILNVAPGSTIAFGTTGTAALFENEVVVLPGIHQGMARVVSNSDQLICSAVVLDAGAAGSPPGSGGKTPGAMSALVGLGASGAAAVCGDNIVQAGEQCDDGGTVGGDCCSPTCQFECDDGDACTQDNCDSATGLCANDAAPATSCLQALKASFQVKDHPTKPVDQIKWKWNRGGGFPQGAIGNPQTVATYSMCVYDMTGASPRVAASLVLPPQNAWLNKAPKGWQYKFKGGPIDGIEQIKIKPGASGKTKFQLKAKGVNLPTPAPFSATKFFDQSPDVTVQVFNDQTSTCWTSSFTSAKKNTVAQFKAKSP